MPKLEPSYLRYVHDQLSSGLLSPENAAALPQGFIGIYEQEFSQNISIDKRQHLLNHLATWALFKGPVSAAFASNILKVSEGEIKDLIDRYSSWFNSPESGKYQLYHERLRVFILQKLNDKEIQTRNEQIISYLESTVKQADGSEDEKYALQFLHNHMALESMLEVDYERLHNYVNQESLWERQIKVSKGYEWSQNAVQQGIKEGARRNHEMNTIRSTVNSVKLMTQEQNSAEAIIELLNEGDYHSALKRAESWEGDRQFKLYLLFIHELTIGTSKESDFRKEACKAILKAIDQTPEDHSILDWTKFYPELAVYRYCEELLKMNLDGIVIWKKGEFDLHSILKSLDKSVSSIHRLVSEIPREYKKAIALSVLAQLLMNQDDKIGSKSILNKAQIIASEVSDSYEKYLAYAALSKTIRDIGDELDGKYAIDMCYSAASNISIDFVKYEAFASISEILLLYDEIERALSIVQEIPDWYKLSSTKVSEVYGILSKSLQKQGDKEGSKSAIMEAINYASQISFDQLRFKAYTFISKILIELGAEKGLKSSFIESIREDIANSSMTLDAESLALAHLSKILRDNGDKVGSKSAMEDSLSAASNILSRTTKYDTYFQINTLLEEQGDKVGSKSAVSELQCAASEIFDTDFRVVYYLSLSTILISQSDEERFKSTMIESLRIKSAIPYDSSYYKKFLSFSDLSKTLMMHGNQEMSLRLVSEIALSPDKFRTYASLHKILMEQGDEVGSEVVMNESLSAVFEMSSDIFTPAAYSIVAQIVMEQGHKEASLIMISEISEDHIKSKAYASISKILQKQGDEKSAKSFIDESLRVAASIVNDTDRSQVLSFISIVLMEQEKHEESFNTASKISVDYVKCDAYVLMSQILSDQGNEVDAELAMKESLNIASEISIDYYKFKSYEKISKIFMEWGEKMKALRIISEIPDDTGNISYKSIAYASIAKILLEQDKKEESLDVYSMISSGSSKIQCLLELGRMSNYFSLRDEFIPEIQEWEKKLLIQGYSEKFLEGNKEIPEVIYYLHDYSQLTSTLSNILFYKAKRACYFEEVRNEEKLDMLGEVLDIQDWRRISSSFSNN